MIDSNKAAPRPRAHAPAGYHRCTLMKDEDIGESASAACNPQQLVQIDGGRYVAVAQGARVSLYATAALDTDRPAVLASTVLPHTVVLLAPSAASAEPAIVAALDGGSLWSVRWIDEPRRGRTPVPALQARPLVEGLPGRTRWVAGAGQRLLVVTEDVEAGRLPVLVEVVGGRVARQAQLPFARLTTVHPLHEEHSDTLVVVDAAHGAHLVGFATHSDAAALQLTRLDPDTRVTAVTALDRHWLLVARKGGELVKVRYAPSREDRGLAADEICHRLREVLHACGCACGCPDDPRQQDPKDPRDPRQPADDEPCEARQRGTAGWTVGALHVAGRYVVAASARGDRLAVFDHQLNPVFERYLGKRGALVATQRKTERLLVQPRRSASLEVWHLADYARELERLPERPLRRPPTHAAQQRTVTFHGLRSRPASPNPHLRVVVFPVLEPGQVFGDADQAKMHALLLEHVYGVAADYYKENSFDTLETVFSVFGVDIAGPRQPLVLPRSFASYFYDDYFAGGLEAIMPADWSAPPVFDGTEALTVRTEPASGTSRDYAIPFAALWTQQTYAGYPLTVQFTGSESLQLDVTGQDGVARTLNLTFGALNLSLAQGGDEAGFMVSLAQHVTAAIRAAESAAGAPVIVQDVVFRRVRTSSNDAQFGHLVGQFRCAATGSGSKGRMSVVPAAGSVPAALIALGLDGPDAVHVAGILGSRNEVVQYFRFCLDAAICDVGEGVGLNDTHLATTITAQEDAAARTVKARILLNSSRGGAGASIGIVAQSNLGGTGWDGAVPVPGSNSDINNRNTMRDHVELANDVFTAALDHIRATAGWDRAAVQALFGDFDAMMIGFVGACPTTVPVADRWSCASAVGAAQLRMFVRNHPATDLNNPDALQAPVTMGTSLLIGQRFFDLFDPGVMAHEIGHGLGLPDLYSAAGFRDDVAYVDDWCQMAGSNGRFNHFCAWAKWAVGWIPESPDPVVNRVLDVPMPAPTGVTTIEAWLVPVEYWDNTMRADVIDEVGADVPIGQMMKVHLGSDGGVVDLIELRARGALYSQSLPPTPALIVTNVLDPRTDRRWAVNGLYRRSVHLLNRGSELTAVGDTWDFASGREFPLKGCKIEILDIRSIRSGSVPLCRVRVVREAAEFIDLYFEDNVPSWRSPDLWVDWPGDNPDPAAPRIYPAGTPTDQGEIVRFPDSGVEPHFMVARPHNAGNVHAEKVKVRWFICDPPGAGDDGRWVERDTRMLTQLAAGDWGIVPFTWNVASGTRSHQCLRAEIIDWKIPSEVDPATGDTLALASDDVILQNNNAQKNVFDFEALT
ncbi:MAG: hypothetical protein DI564_03630 [Rhodanobacter denitrificans]|uniref:Peptidase M6-like domain-containing protein n=1 Tax=Rhodanobacter denitrificans TaxID=666685 RepID=A0A2W5MER7_9GAMM|nr:MAG: hypothetical protein DI564_03630 [Rhodanobacter denitrificans]